MLLCTVSCLELEELIHSRKPTEEVIKLVGRIKVVVVDILDMYEIHSTNLFCMSLPELSTCAKVSLKRFLVYSIEILGNKKRKKKSWEQKKQEYQTFINHCSG